MLLVIGITGHSGRFFHDALVARGYAGRVRCLVRRNSEIGFLETSPLHLECVVGDLNEDVSLDGAMKGVQEVLHITNIRFTPAVVNAALRNGVSSVVAVHTTGLYSRFRAASAEYESIESDLAEKLKKHPDFRLCILRPTMIFGDLDDHNVSKFVRMMDRWRIFPLIDCGSGRLQPVNARDLGRAYAAVLALPSEDRRPEYILSGERAVSMRELLQLILDALGKRTRFINCPGWLGVTLALICKFLTLGRLDVVEKVQRMTEDRTFAHAEATEDFGYQPEPLEQGIQREVQAYLHALSNARTSH